MKKSKIAPRLTRTAYIKETLILAAIFKDGTQNLGFTNRRCAQT